MEACEQNGVRFVFSTAEEDDDDWDEMLDEMDDPWMREPASPTEFERGLQVADEPAQSSASPYSEEAGFRSISAAELHLLSNEESDVVLLDVRTTMELSIRRIPGSVHIPLDSLTRDAAAAELSGRPVVVVVGSGDHRSRQAAVRLKRVYGFADVRHLDGGVEAWEAEQQRQPKAESLAAAMPISAPNPAERARGGHLS
eukprot:CAMPEP_0177601520 /NCGR_PEP_ID=MMETSP0419_2-20121207/14310_1 /TAXON_ID=582737 /ORGANISM="Tetraselmis sp., Strain GSL018" /LENGTH=198 /DNA_ID=CAMNT_0019094805 /DNA_START=347 /DNA_END=940 /DNA_ORIENTATION=-